MAADMKMHYAVGKDATEDVNFDITATGKGKDTHLTHTKIKY